MPVRRYADPISVQHVWDAVRCTLQQRQQTDIVRLTKYLQRVCDVSTVQAEQYIRRVYKDNFLVCVKKTAQKGTKAGITTECFKIPSTDNNTPVDDGFDWYCIECHLAGNVVNCRTCYRVFHPECAGKIRASINKRTENIPSTSTMNLNEQNVSSSRKEDESIAIEDQEISVEDLDGTCSICRMLREEKPGLIERDELNYLLNFTLNRIRIWLPSNITDVMAPRVQHPWMTEQEISWRVRQLLYQTMDIPFMEMKLRTKEYTRLAEFHADVITIQHNVAIFHGLESQEMQGSELMLTDSRYDVVELQQCIDCYRHSNEKRNEQWFCIPCRPAHDLVWAKQKGYPYWPAKVIRITTDGQHDVRFFGAKHLRALVDKNYIKPIDTNIQKLQVKRTQAFNKAMQELTEHQRLIQSPDEVAEIMAHTPEIKFKSPNTKNKQKRLKERDDNLDDDVYEFEDAPNTPQPVVTEKKKRGRKPGSLNKSTKAMMQRFAAEKDQLKPSPERRKSETDLHTDQTNKTQTLLSDDSSDFNHDHVSSSTENVPMFGRLNAEGPSIGSRSRSTSGSGTQQLERVFSDPVENLRRQLENLSDKESMIRIALETMQLEMDRMQNAHSENMRSLNDAQNVQISEIKKKQWCYNCEQEAIYHCCWNTAYCSTLCQQQHWQSEHKKVCRRKR